MTDIHVSAVESDQNLIVAWVDNGVEIPDEEKKLILERGFGKNTGLGLFLIREILSLTEMSIRDAGVPGSGAGFEIIVPKGGCRKT
ncbi:ATP-binding protein [uncultured Methanospirillum sp.]|uniref:ATP-binding protein n=1 Tax=uncultured Methanospirillum sp. TaxID=262503 RepID=UPI0029C8DE2A|nr:ATP-binding protein [uncultured Methanospirillum sp.]